MSSIILPISSDENGNFLVSTLDFADGLAIQHASLMKTIRDYQEAIERGFGQVRFEIRTVRNSVGAVNDQSYALLTEDQSLFIGSLSRNSERVVEFKTVLVQSFAIARQRLRAPMLPQNYKEALQALLGKVEENERLQAENEALKPKAEYADTVLLSQSEILTSIIAKELGKSAVTLNRILKDKGIQHRRGNTWVLNHQYQDKGYTRIRTHAHSSTSGTMRTEHHLVWTEKGRQFIHSLVNPNLDNTPQSGNA